MQKAYIITARDACRSETGNAAVVLRAEAEGKANPRDIIDWAPLQTAANKVPKIVEFVDHLPK